MISFACAKAPRPLRPGPVSWAGGVMECGGGGPGGGGRVSCGFGGGSGVGGFDFMSVSLGFALGLHKFP